MTYQYIDRGREGNTRDGNKSEGSSNGDTDSCQRLAQLRDDRWTSLRTGKRYKAKGAVRSYKIASRQNKASKSCEENLFNSELSSSTTSIYVANGKDCYVSIYGLARLVSELAVGQREKV